MECEWRDDHVHRSVENVDHYIWVPHRGLKAGLKSICSSCHLPLDLLPHVALLAHGITDILISSPNLESFLHPDVAAPPPPLFITICLPVSPFVPDLCLLFKFLCLSKVKPFLLYRNFPPSVPSALISFFFQIILTSPPDWSSNTQLGSYHSSDCKLSRTPHCLCNKAQDWWSCHSRSSTILWRP